MCKEIILGLLRAVQYLHGMGFMHGDISPKSILCHEDPAFVVKLCDFDSSAQLGQPFPHVEHRGEQRGEHRGEHRGEQRGEGLSFKGTPDYRAPELLFGEPGQLLACVELDYFALGLVMWQIVKRQRWPLLHGLPVERLLELYRDQDTFDAEARFASVPSQLAEFVPCLRSLCSMDPTLRPAGFGKLPSTQSYARDLRLSADQGNVDAQYSLGNSYYHEARRYYQLAAKGGHSEAQKQLSELSISDSVFESHYGSNDSDPWADDSDPWADIKAPW
jgi:serine/threonine protein kinase